MASLSVIKDATKPLDTSNWISSDRKPPAKATEKEKAQNSHETSEKSANANPVPEDMDVDAAIQESIPWTEVKHQKKNSSNEEPTPTLETTLKKVKVTINIRAPRDLDQFSPAKLHIDTLHAIHKHDESAIFFNHSGDKKVNIEAGLNQTQYKDTFKPVEKRVGRGPTTISISHDICITSKASDIKEAIFPYLKKNKVFLYFNPKPGLEHFSAIGVLFGPNPDFTWRDSLADLLIDTMRSAITKEEIDILGTTSDGKPKILLSLNIQKVGLNSQEETTSVALEVRVPSGFERIYTTIIERLYEKGEEDALIIPEKLGKFFPYYMKSKMPEVFVFLMRQQNAEMTEAAVIPIFGYTPDARKQQITIDGQQTTVELALATTKNIVRIEATPSSWNLHKYLVIVKKEHKESVQKAVKHIFNKIEGELGNQPENIPRPRCGGSEKSPPTVTPKETEDDQNMTSAYMVSLETLALAQNPQDAGPTAPPKKPRRFTISYASAAKSGIINENGKSDSQLNQQQPSNQESQHSQNVDKNHINEASEKSSLSRAVNQSNPPNQLDIDSELKKLKDNMESRMQQQDDRISEIIHVMKSLNEDFEKRMTHVVLAALSREKEQVQEITLGTIYDKSHAPLADEQGNLPYGGKVQLGGPLDRLHHVEVTIQQMANALDTIADYMIQKDPSARKKLFVTDDDSDDDSDGLPPTEKLEYARKEDDDYLNKFIDNDVPMKMIREVSGQKRSLKQQIGADEQNQIRPETNSSPQRSPPTKRDKPSNKPSANPDDTPDRTRGES
jgi:hypothetical protein